MIVNRISIVYTDNPFGETVKNSLIEALKAQGMTATPHKLDPPGTQAAAVVEAMAPGNYQAVFLTMLSQAAIPSIREIKKANRAAFLYTFSPVDTSVVVKELGAGAAGLSVAQVFPIPSGSRVRVVAEYIQALAALGRGTPSFYGLEAFVEAKVLVEGLRRAGGGANSESLVRSLETFNEYDAGGFASAQSRAAASAWQ